MTKFRIAEFFCNQTIVNKVCQTCSLASLVFIFLSWFLIAKCAFLVYFLHFRESKISHSTAPPPWNTQGWSIKGLQFQNQSVLLLVVEVIFITVWHKPNFTFPRRTPPFTGNWTNSCNLSFILHVFAKILCFPGERDFHGFSRIFGASMIAFLPQGSCFPDLFSWLSCSVLFVLFWSCCVLFIPAFNLIDFLWLWARRWPFIFLVHLFPLSSPSYNPINVRLTIPN